MSKATIRLGQPDCQALGVPDAMPMDLDRLRVSEVRALRTAGFDDPEQFTAALRGKSIDALFAMVWLACKRHGYTGGFADLDFDLADLDIDVPPDDTTGDGQGEASTPDDGDPTPT